MFIFTRVYKALHRSSVMLVKQSSSGRDSRVTCHPQNGASTFLSYPWQRNEMLPWVCSRRGGILLLVLAWLEVTGSGVAFQKPVPHEGKRTWYGMPWLMPRRDFTETFPTLAIFAVKQTFPWTVLPALLGCLQLNSAPCSLSKPPRVTSARSSGCGKPWEYKNTESSWASNCWGLGEHPMAEGRTLSCSSGGSTMGPITVRTPGCLGFRLYLVGHPHLKRNSFPSSLETLQYFRLPRLEKLFVYQILIPCSTMPFNIIGLGGNKSPILSHTGLWKKVE